MHRIQFRFYINVQLKFFISLFGTGVREEESSIGILELSSVF